MKVAFVLPSYATTLGGAETYTFNLAQHLAKRGVEVTLFIASKQPKERQISNNFTLVELKSSHVEIDPGNPFSFAAINKLVVGDFDVLHVHQLRTLCNVVCSSFGRAKRLPVVLTDHGGGWLYSAAPRLCALFPDSYAAVSNFSLRWLSNFAPKKKASVVYAGIDTGLFKSGYNTDSLKDKLSIAGRKVILYVGRLLPHKGVDLLLSAFSSLPQGCVLIIVGSTSDFQYLEYLKHLAAKHSGRIFFLGSVPGEQLPLLYNACDVYVQPSTYYDYRGRYHGLTELLGLSKLEAMACGKPVVVTEVGGLPELVSEKTGLIVKSGDELQMAQAIQFLLDNDDLRKSFGREAELLVRNQLTWDIVAKRVTDFYKSLLEA